MIMSFVWVILSLNTFLVLVKYSFSCLFLCFIAYLYTCRSRLSFFACFCYLFFSLSHFCFVESVFQEQPCLNIFYLSAYLLTKTIKEKMLFQELTRKLEVCALLEISKRCFKEVFRAMCHLWFSTVSQCLDILTNNYFKLISQDNKKPKTLEVLSQ